MLLAGAFVSLVLRDYFPEKWLIFLSHVVILVGALVVTEGLRAFRERPPYDRRLLLVAFAGSLGACGYSVFVLNSLSGRIVSVSPLIATLIFMSAATIGYGVPLEDRPAYWGTALAFGLDGLVMVVRFFEALFTNIEGNSDSTNPLEIINALSISLATALAVLGLFVSINLRLRREIETLVLFDPLTGLPNRRHFEQRYEAACQRAAHGARRIALIYMDLNGFKGINDWLGHEAGDEALRIVATRLSGVVRRTDCLVRLAGDEFALLIEDVKSRDEVARLARRIREIVQCDAILAGQRVSLSISCGFATFPEDVEDMSHLLRRADAAMYAEKRVPYAQRTG